jgi:hypothetical protein
MAFSHVARTNTFSLQSIPTDQMFQLNILICTPLQGAISDSTQAVSTHEAPPRFVRPRLDAPICLRIAAPPEKLALTLEECYEAASLLRKDVETEWQKAGNPLSPHPSLPYNPEGAPIMMKAPSIPSLKKMVSFSDKSTGSLSQVFEIPSRDMETDTDDCSDEDADGCATPRF